MAPDIDKRPMSLRDPLNSAAMEALKGYVQHLDSKSMPQFLDQVSEARDNETSRYFAITLYSELVQVHKQAVVPYIPRIMASLVRCLPFSGGHQQLHESCAQVVATIARYTVDPINPNEANQEIISSLCSPLLPAMSSKVDAASVGASFCLQALVESEKWKYASTDLHEQVCTSVSSCLTERSNQARRITLLYLAKSVVRFCRKSAQSHASTWLKVCVENLQIGSNIHSSWKLHLAAAQLISTVVKVCNVDKLGIDLQEVAEALEQCPTDKVPGVQVAVSEALERVKRLPRKAGSSSPLSYSDGHSPSQLGQELRKNCSGIDDSSSQDLSSSASPKSGISSHGTLSSMDSNLYMPLMGSKRSPVFPPQQLMDKTKYYCNSCGSPAILRQSKLKQNAPSISPKWRSLHSTPADKLSMGTLTSRPLRSMSLGTENKEKDPKSFTSGYSKKNDKECMRGSGVETSTQTNTDTNSRQSLQNTTSNFTGCTGNGSVNASIRSNVSHDKETREVLMRCNNNSSCIYDSNKPNRLVDDVLCNGCTDLLFTHDAETSVANECLAVSDKGSPKQGEESKISMSDFIFASPRRLLHSILSDGPVEHSEMVEPVTYSNGDNLRTPVQPAAASGERAEQENTVNQHLKGSEEYHPKSGSPISSCCTSDDLNSSPDQSRKVRPYRKICRFQSGIDCKRLSALLDNCGIKAICEGQLSINGFANELVSAVGAKEFEQVQSSSIEDGTVAEADISHEEDNNDLTKVSVGLDFKLRDVEFVNMKNSSETLKTENRKAFFGTSLGVVCAIGIIILAIVIVRHVNEPDDLHVLVPT